MLNLPKGPALRERVFAALRADIADTRSATFARVNAVRAIINEEPPMRENKATPEGRELGEQLARLCDGEAKRHSKDGRCATCAFRAGDHLANGSPETLMTALKCAAEREPFWCHEQDQPCAGWALMRFGAAETVALPWDYIGGAGDNQPVAPNGGDA